MSDSALVWFFQSVLVWIFLYPSLPIILNGQVQGQVHHQQVQLHQENQNNYLNSITAISFISFSNMSSMCIIVQGHQK